MKKILLLLTLSLVSTSFAGGNTIEVRGSYDLSSSTSFKNDYNSEYNLDKFVKRGLHLGVEYRRELLANFQVGGGLEYRNSDMDQPKNERVMVEGVDYSYDSDSLTSIPVYLTARYNFKNPTGITPYVKANLGYSINSGEVKTNLHSVKRGEWLESYNVKMKNNLYYGLGAGIEYKNFLVDLTYDITKTEGKERIDYYDDDSVNYNYKFDIKKLTLSFGYQFNF